MGAIRGVLEHIFSKPKITKQINGYFDLLDGYTPVWTTYDGGLYEMELTRACIHAGATHASKLSPNVEGADLRKIKHILERQPNPFMTTSQFLYRTFTILEVSNTVYIIPILDKFERLTGYYPLSPSMTEVLDVGGEPWLRYTFANGATAAIEFKYVGLVSKFQHKNDFRGEDNSAMQSTLDLINLQNQGIAQGITNGASFRFIAKHTNLIKVADLKKDKDKFVTENFASDGTGEVLLFPAQYTDIKQVISQPRIVDPEQMKLIDTRVFNYFGCNEDVLQNKVNGDKWAAYYEGKMEPFAVQLGETMTAMTYTSAEFVKGNKIVWSSSRLQNMTNQDKLNYSVQMFDRGLASNNDIAEIWNRPKTADGDKRYIRREYIEVSKLDAQDNPKETEVNNNANAGKQTVQSNDSDSGAGGTDKAD